MSNLVHEFAYSTDSIDVLHVRDVNSAALLILFVINQGWIWLFVALLIAGLFLWFLHNFTMMVRWFRWLKHSLGLQLI